MSTMLGFVVNETNLLMKKNSNVCENNNTTKPRGEDKSKNVNNKESFSSLELKMQILI